jgi:hypothetical protein
VDYQVGERERERAGKRLIDRSTDLLIDLGSESTNSSAHLAIYALQRRGHDTAVFCT